MNTKQPTDFFFINILAGLFYGISLGVYWVFFTEFRTCSICGYLLPILCTHIMFIIFVMTFALWSLARSLFMAQEAFQLRQKLSFTVGIGLTAVILALPFLADFLDYPLDRLPIPSLGTVIYMLLYSLLLLRFRAMEFKSKVRE